MDQLLQSINKKSEVLVHCSAGIGRTGFFFGAMLIHMGCDDLKIVVIDCVEQNMSEPMSPIKLKALNAYYRWYLDNT